MGARLTMVSGYGILVFISNDDYDSATFFELPVIPFVIKEYEDIYGEFADEEEMQDEITLAEVGWFIDQHYPLLYTEVGGFDGYDGETVVFVKRTVKEVSSRRSEFAINNDEVDAHITPEEEVQLREVATLFDVKYNPHVYTVSYYG